MTRPVPFCARSALLPTKYGRLGHIVSERASKLELATHASIRSVQLLTDWTQTYGQVFVWHFGTQAVLVVTDPEEVTRFCSNSNKQDNLPKWAKTYLVLEPVSFAMFCVLL